MPNQSLPSNPKRNVVNPKEQAPKNKKIPNNKQKLKTKNLKTVIYEKIINHYPLPNNLQPFAYPL